MGQERQHAERRGQIGNGVLLVELAADVVGQRVHVQQRQARIDFSERAPDLSGNRTGIAGGTDFKL